MPKHQWPRRSARRNNKSREAIAVEIFYLGERLRSPWDEDCSTAQGAGIGLIQPWHSWNGMKWPASYWSSEGGSGTNVVVDRAYS